MRATIMLSEACMIRVLGLQASIAMSGALSSTLSPGTISQCFSLNIMHCVRNSFWMCSRDSLNKLADGL